MYRSTTNLLISFLLIYFRPNGVNFEVRGSDVHIPTPDVGDVVTFSYESWARRELPVGPKIYRVRIDLSWDDVMQSAVQEKQHLNGKQKKQSGETKAI